MLYLRDNGAVPSTPRAATAAALPAPSLTGAGRAARALLRPALPLLPAPVAAGVRHHVRKTAVARRPGARNAASRWLMVGGFALCATVGIRLLCMYYLGAASGGNVAAGLAGLVVTYGKALQGAALCVLLIGFGLREETGMLRRPTSAEEAETPAAQTHTAGGSST